ncbi:tetratricopeptide repeat protein [Nordella sp. HKS 07]|uniref:TPR end-of-group domain-containing protein n=1 Tax=Nordella sp. HKS 07 TaxID=2712222 RepID=UPI0013E1F124|nr:tetratricopeptide repeat protein [Nordella sp. HKS 07]QIG50152.1 tetratricopeptide repeat protein [Nordella sp. HKS 07]
MGARQVERRLAAILAADVVGYSRLMGANEVGTLEALKAHRSELLDRKIADYQGRIAKLTGDGMLVEFPSVVNAVECALEIQREMRIRNSDVPQDRRIEFRIGINLSDIIIEDNDLYGEGVNIAARIEAIARPGGISVSAVVRENVGNRLELTFEDTGEHVLKNIERPVRVFDVYPGSPLPGSAAVTPASVKPAVTDRPSIAVLPFANVSGDPEQEYFSDGITDDIITDLSQISGLFVVSRNSSFLYKGKAVNMQQAATELGVKFLLEGSVCKAGQRVRITSQLIDGASGGHLWAARYDRDLTDIFAVQDEITHMIVDQLKIRLLVEERTAIARTPTANVHAYTDYLRGRQLLKMRTRSSLTLGRSLFARAAELDPLYARAYAGMANCESYLKSSEGVAVAVETILATAGKALSIDPGLAEAHAARGMALNIAGRSAEATSAFETALSLDPNNYEANLFYGEFCLNQGDFDLAARHFVRALEVEPDDYRSPLLLTAALRSLGRYDEVEGYARLGWKRAEEAHRLHPDISDPIQLGACALAVLGERDRAKEWVARALAIDPEDSNARYNAAVVYSVLGELDRAIDLLEILFQGQTDSKIWVAHDSYFDPIRSHPRYKKLIGSVE